MAEAVVNETGFSRTVYILWGILLIVAGFFLVTRPAITALVWVEIMAIAWIIGGIFDFIRSIAERGSYWGLRLVLAIISIIAGVYIIGNPVYGTIFTIQIAFLFFAIAALVNGFFNIFAGFKAEGGTSWGAVIIGVIQIIAGGWLLMNPVAGMLALVPVLGIVMIVGGIFSIIASFYTGSSPASSPQPVETKPAETPPESPVA